MIWKQGFINSLFENVISSEDKILNETDITVNKVN